MWWSSGSPAASPRVGARLQRDDSGPTAGFTLIEILVAFAITTVLLGALLQLFSIGLYSSGRTKREIEATLLAESVLEQLGRLEPLLDIASEERIAGRYRVQIDMQRRDDLVGSGAPGFLAPYGVDVAVGWLEGRRQRLISLHTVRLGRAR